MPSASHLIFLSPKVAKIRDDEGQKVWLGLQGKPSEAEPEGKRRKGWEPVGRREGREMRLGIGDSEAVTRTGPWAGVRVPPGPLFLVPARPSSLPFFPSFPNASSACRVLAPALGALVTRSLTWPWWTAGPGRVARTPTRPSERARPDTDSSVQPSGQGRCGGDGPAGSGARGAFLGGRTGAGGGRWEPCPEKRGTRRQASPVSHCCSGHAAERAPRPVPTAEPRGRRRLPPGQQHKAVPGPPAAGQCPGRGVPSPWLLPAAGLPRGGVAGRG